MTTLAPTPTPLDRGLGLDRPRLGSVRTVPNLVTLVRTVAAVTLGLLGVAAHRPGLLVAAYAVYWVGDILDGWSARRLGQETRLGAVLDIVSDRACTSVLGVGLVAHLPGVLPLVAVFLLSFMVLDTMLSLAFLCWPLVSPNDFHLVDHPVWRLNWSPAAKAANTAGVIAAIALGAYSVGLAIALVVLGVKVWSAARVLRLVEEQGRCAWLAPTVLAVATGTGSALLPIVNAEVYAVGAAGRSQPGPAVAMVVCLALGQTLGKLLLFETARRGGGRLGRWMERRETRHSGRGGRWTQRITTALGSRRTGNPLVLLSAALGLPPLAAVSLAAGASGQRRWEFAVLCLVGRTARFAALALPAAYALS